MLVCKSRVSWKHATFLVVGHMVVEVGRLKCVGKEISVVIHYRSGRVRIGGEVTVSTDDSASAIANPLVGLQGELQFTEFVDGKCEVLDPFPVRKVCARDRDATRERTSRRVIPGNTGHTQGSFPSHFYRNYMYVYTKKRTTDLPNPLPTPPQKKSNLGRKFFGHVTFPNR